MTYSDNKFLFFIQTIENIDSDWLGWFAIFPVELYSEKSHSQSIIAYHPGVRSFLTGFDGEKFIDIGNRDITRIFRLGQHIDKLIRAKTGLKGRKN